MKKEEALAIAKAAAEAKGWPWQEPLHVQRRRKFVLFGSVAWHITTNAMSRGGNVRIAVDDESRAVVEQGFASY
jgi:hypothetical protein